MQPCRVRSLSSSPSSWCCSPDESRAGPARNQKGEAGDEGKKGGQGHGAGAALLPSNTFMAKGQVFSNLCRVDVCASNTSLMGLHACL